MIMMIVIEIIIIIKIIIIIIIITIMITIMIMMVIIIIITDHSPSGALQGQYKQIKTNIVKKKKFLKEPITWAPGLIY